MNVHVELNAWYLHIGDALPVPLCVGLDDHDIFVTATAVVHCMKAWQQNYDIAATQTVWSNERNMPYVTAALLDLEDLNRWENIINIYVNDTHDFAIVTLADILGEILFIITKGSAIRHGLLNECIFHYDINLATKEELMQLGCSIGIRTAKSVIAHRPFVNKRQLAYYIPWYTKKKREKLQPLLKIGCIGRRVLSARCPKRYKIKKVLEYVIRDITEEDYPIFRCGYKGFQEIDEIVYE